PPDFPLEPGARNRGASLEPDFAEDAAPAVENNSQSNFIAAARRAAQAAQAEMASEAAEAAVRPGRPQ
ncbi:hypothetical protein, partial [Klebsiella pneumoniae]|uniref:hypothetical protein n=1 Tax=Klebsiella pneumoniae TaxID=573 RepID=UPI0013CF3FD7